MTCPKCGEETNGIKINGRLFCSVCGEKIETGDVTPKFEEKTEEKIGQPKIQESEPEEPEAKIIPKEGDINVLNAELSALDLIEKEAILEEEKEEEKFLKELQKEKEKELHKTKKIEPTNKNKKKEKEKEKKKKNIKIEDRSIKKHNRKRTDLKPDHFMVIPGEPNPIKLPELDFPKEMEVETIKTSNLMTGVEPSVFPELPESITTQVTEPEATTQTPVTISEPNLEENILEEKISYPLFEKGKADELAHKKQEKQKALSNFLQSSIAETNKKEGKKKKKKKKRNTRFIVILVSFLVLLGSLISIFLYVNLYWANPDLSRQQAEDTVKFDFKKPTYIPLGYEIDYYTTASEKEIKYYYTFATNKERTLTIKISETGLTEEQILEEKVKSMGNSYTEFKSFNTTIWAIDEQKMIFKKDNLLYLISASDKITTEELTKIAEGLI